MPHTAIGKSFMCKGFKTKHYLFVSNASALQLRGAVDALLYDQISNSVAKLLENKRFYLTNFMLQELV